MSQFQICNNQNMDYTLVSNQFIDSFLTSANDFQIKIYLYLLRHMNHSDQNSISAIADFFNYSEKDVLRALSYWERQKVLQLTFDENDHLTAVCFCELSSLTDTKDCTAPPIPPIPSVPSSSLTQDFSSFKKKDYSLDELKEFQARENTSQLFFIAESYLEKTLSASDIRSLLFLSEELHFSFDLIDYLLQYCVDLGKKDFRYIEKVALRWAQDNITTPEDARLQTFRYDKNTYVVMNALGKSSQPTPAEAEFIKRWYQIYGFTSDIILEACERTVLATDKHRFEYADKILNNWKSTGICHKNDIEKADASFASRQKKKPASPPGGTGSDKNKFNRFQQNEYDFDALEKELLSN